MTDKPDAVAELVEVTQADIDALHAAYTEQWGKPAFAVYNADHWLAKAFARHRIATRTEGRREGIEAAAKVETGWLIEHADEPKWLILSTAEALCGVDWTKDSIAAVRFARREDAEAYVWTHFGGEGPIRITEHRWG